MLLFYSSCLSFTVFFSFSPCLLLFFSHCPFLSEHNKGFFFFKFAPGLASEGIIIIVEDFLKYVSARHASLQNGLVPQLHNAKWIFLLLLRVMRLKWEYVGIVCRGRSKQCSRIQIKKEEMRSSACCLAECLTQMTELEPHNKGSGPNVSLVFHM